MEILITFRTRTVIRERLLQNYPNVQFVFRSSMGEATEELKSAEVLVTYGEDLNDNLLESAKNLKWIMVLSAGLDKMPLVAIKKKGIIVTNARGIHKTPMAEYTIGMMLQVARKSKQLLQNEQTENWDRSVKMVELASKTLTVLGTGAIGQEIARLAKAFNMYVIGVNRNGTQPASFDEIFTVNKMGDALKQGDFIVSVLPSTSETVHLLKEEHFKIMKEDAVFINIGRGDVVKESVLLNVMKDNEISHAVLDVFEKEPLEKGHPLWGLENVTVTPHISGLSSNYQPRGFEIFDYNLQQYISGQANYKNLINLERGY